MEEQLPVVLAVDDDEAVLQTLQTAIRSAGLQPVLASSGEEALQLTGEHTYDLILMDINMRGMDGFETIRAMRERNITTPLIIVSGRKEDYDTLYGIDIGADDYVTKPFNPVTLGAKMKALLRRSRSSEINPVISAGPFTYNTTTLRFYKNDTEIPLSAKENSIMKIFLDNLNRIFTKSALYEMVWGSIVVDEDAVMVYINRLRQKLEDDPANPKHIQTVRGLGYRFVV